MDEEGAKLKQSSTSSPAKEAAIVDSSIDRASRERPGGAAVLVFEVPFASQESVLIRQMKGTGKLVSQRTTRNAQQGRPENELTTAHIIVTLAGGTPIVPDDQGLGTYVRKSLNLSFQILATIVMTIIVGLSGIVPCVLLIWIGFKLYVVMFGAGQGARAMAIPTPATAEGQSAEGEPPAKS